MSDFETALYGGRPRILVVDDNTSIHEDYRKILAPAPTARNGLDEVEASVFGPDRPPSLPSRECELDSAFQGQEALEKVRAAVHGGRPYSIVFMDVRMPPGWDGVETTSRLWEVDVDLQVVLCTAYADYSMEDLIGRLGHSDRFVILKKPFDVAEVRQLANALTRKRLLEEIARRKLEYLERLAEERLAVLAQVEHKHRALFENLSDGIFQRTPEGRYLLANPALAQIFGCATVSEFIQLTAGGDTQFSQNPAPAPSFRGRVQQAGEGWKHEMEIRCRDGTRKWISESARLIQPPSGGSPFWQGIVTDITERKRAEEALQSSRAELSAVYEHAPLVMCLFDEDQRVVRLNRAAVDFAGRPETDLLGLSGGELFGCANVGDDPRGCGFGPRCARCVLRLTIADTLKTGATHKAVEARPRLAAGQPSADPFVLASTARLTVEGKTLVLLCLEDMTARRRAEQERDRMEVQLRHAQKLESVGQLAAGIAHEINTPVQYVGDNLRFLQDAFQGLSRCLAQYERLGDAVEQGIAGAGMVAASRETAQVTDLAYLRDEIPKSIKESLEGINRTARIVGALKEFSHPGDDRKTPIDLNRTIDSTLTVSRNEWKYVADLETDFDPSLPPVPCFPSELNQVILNLVVNSGHAISESVGISQVKGRITVRTRRDGNWVEIRIEDTGTGIPEAIRDRVFDPFFTTKPVGKGTGQGLAIAHSVIVDKHEGTIHFETEMGKGTTFIIRLPLFDSKPKTERRAS